MYPVKSSLWSREGCQIYSLAGQLWPVEPYDPAGGHPAAPSPHAVCVMGAGAGARDAAIGTGGRSISDPVTLIWPVGPDELHTLGIKGERKE